MHYVVDKIVDGKTVVLESLTDDEPGAVIPISWAPEGLREGDVVSIQDVLVVDPDLTSARLDQARRKREQLPKSSRGNLSL